MDPLIGPDVTQKNTFSFFYFSFKQHFHEPYLVENLRGNIKVCCKPHICDTKQRKLCQGARLAEEPSSLLRMDVL